MRILRSRRLVHALIAVAVFLAVAGLYRLETAGHGAHILSSWEYGFRDNILTVGGRHTPADARLVFLGIDRGIEIVTRSRSPKSRPRARQPRNIARCR